MKIKKYAWWKIFTIASAVALCDQISKLLILNVVFDHNSDVNDLTVTSFLNLVLSWNHGISFGMMNDLKNGSILISTLSLCIITSLMIWYKKTQDIQLITPLSLIVGGAVGNIIDRIHYGAVLDFIDVHGFGYHYPAFNIADSAICIGALLLLRIKKI